ncbi:hypothetical protein KIPB_004074 [Kipferlia bialata]|uniref:Solute-binding protein family 3/N-terminal domain-containing protein n=1 Tax=Kipferlia bialata TaxID=797122 RepID=A0A9K3CVG3_9EUKA|nr:hypothetical protein KIPB_004074 [Kipferlia bialata]|eukprot:g4074.t1
MAPRQMTLSRMEAQALQLLRDYSIIADWIVRCDAASGHTLLGDTQIPVDGTEMDPCAVFGDGSLMLRLASLYQADPFQIHSPAKFYQHRSENQLRWVYSTDLQVVCVDGTFTGTVTRVANDEYPVFFSGSSTSSSRLVLDVRPTISFRTGGVGFATLCDTSAANAAKSMFAPLLEPVAINLLAVLLLSHMVFANLIYCTQHFGNSSSRTERYEKEALMAFYFSVLGYDLSKINTSLGRLLAGIDTLLQSVLMTLFVSAVTVVSITASDSQFDPDSLKEYSVAAVDGSGTYNWVKSTGAKMLDLNSDYSNALSLLQTGGADAICSMKEPLNQVIKDNQGLICEVDGQWNITPKVVYIHDTYTEYGDNFNVALQRMKETGVLDDLAATWLDTPVEAWGNLGLEVALWASLGLLGVGLWLGILTVSKFRTTLVKRKGRDKVTKGGNSTLGPRLAV